MTRTEVTENAQGRSWWRTSKAWWFVGIAAGLALIVGVVIEEANKPPPMPYGAFLDQLEVGNVASVTFQGTEIDGRFKRPLDATLPTGTGRQEIFRSRAPDVGDPTLVPALRQQHVAIDVNSPSQWTSLLAGIPLPMLIFLGAIVVGGLVRLVRGGKARSTSAVPMHPMQGMMGLVSGLFGRQQQAAGPAGRDDDVSKAR